MTQDDLHPQYAGHGVEPETLNMGLGFMVFEG